MSENVEKIRRGQEGFTRADESMTRDFVADDVEWGTTAAFPGLETVYHGPDGMRDWMESVRSAWEWFEVSTDEVIVDTEDEVLLVEHLKARGRGSGAEVEMTIYAIYSFEDGLVKRRRVFMDREEALAAVAEG
jgi:ketosteroid isomerase-like protein